MTSYFPPNEYDDPDDWGDRNTIPLTDIYNRKIKIVNLGGETLVVSLDSGATKRLLRSKAWYPFVKNGVVQEKHLLYPFIRPSTSWGIINPEVAAKLRRNPIEHNLAVPSSDGLLRYIRGGRYVRYLDALGLRVWTLEDAGDPWTELAREIDDIDRADTHPVAIQVPDFR